MTANVNPETQIPYGVINGNKVPGLWEDITTNGTNVRVRDRDEQIKEEMTSLLSDHLDEKNLKEAIDEVMNRVNEFEANSGFESDTDTYEYTDPEGNQFRLGELGGAPLIWCVKTDTIVSAMRCSPCVPNAGDLDTLSENGIRCYGVPKRYLESKSELER